MASGKQFSKRELVDQFSAHSNIENAKIAYKYILQCLNVETQDISEDTISRFKKSLLSFVGFVEERWHKANRTKDRFESQNKTWLDSTFQIPDEINHKSLLRSEPSTSKTGRPSLSFAESSERSKRRHATLLKQQEQDTDKLLMAGAMSARAEKRIDLAKILTEAAKSPTRPSKMRQVMLQPASKIFQYTPEEALSLILDSGLSKHQYMQLRIGAKSKFADIYPRYELVLEAKCTAMPVKSSMKISETGNLAEVNLQDLLNHTVIRISTLNTDVIMSFMERTSQTKLKVDLICIWGLDAATGHSVYDQRTSEEVTSLLAVSMVPLRLVNGNDVLWINRTPQSYRYCRPIRLSFVKETESVVKAEVDIINRQIQQLGAYTIHLSNSHAIQVRCLMCMTMIDGKILNHLTGASSMQMCPICKATPTLFNNLDNRTTGVFAADKYALQFGVSPLHCWIRFMECCLNISYRLEFKKWQAKGSILQKMKKERQKLVGENLKSQLGLIVDKVRPNSSGTSNTGNTARRAFQDYQKFAEILGLNEELIKNFRTILIALSCQLPINPMKFEDLCLTTAELYVHHYNWFYMPSSVHKILMHGAQILSQSVLPVGIMSEEAGESRHKFYRRDREFHSRKIGPRETMQDIFNRALQSSDPLISSFRLNRRKRLELPSEVVNMLLIPTDEPSKTSTDQQEAEQDEEEQEDATGLYDMYNLLDDLTLESENV